MWVLSNSTPYRAGRAWARDMDGREVWLIAIRARFLVNRDGSLTLADETKQSDVNIAPEIIGNGLQAVLRAETDLPHMKVTTDILVDGHAHAPTSYLAKCMRVRIRVATIDKELMVFGDRIWDRKQLSTPKPFASMPITYQRAFGGPDLDKLHGTENHSWYELNPAGVGFSSSASALEGQPAPNIEIPGELISSPRDRPRPAGFGPLMGHWPQRRRYAGTYDQAWENKRLPLLPMDFDPTYYQAAPSDQQSASFLRGGEPVLLEGLHPSGSLSFQLPRVSLVFETVFDDLTRVRHAADLHTVIFEPDWPAVSLVWHTRLECHSRVTLLRETRIWERQRIRAS